MLKNLFGVTIMFAFILSFAVNSNAQWVEKWNSEHNMNLQASFSGSNIIQAAGIVKGDFYGNNVPSVVAYTAGTGRSNVVILNGTSGNVEFSKDLSAEFGPILSDPLIADIDNDGRDEIVFSFEMRTVAYEYTGSVGMNNSKNQTMPERIKLEQNYPNPFNPTTTIDYELPVIDNVQIKIYDVQGKLVKTLFNARMPAGQHSIIWDGKNNSGNQVATGTYFYQIQLGNFAQAKKMIILR